MRNGPGKRYPVKWLYQREGLPVKITNEYKHWREVVDHDGAKGWMHKSVLSGRRTAIVKQDATMMRDKPNEHADIVVKLMKGVVVDIHDCRRDWCEVEVKDREGWVPTWMLWGS